ncbi:hypothetical protein BGX29_002454 [Mortierella sp. GBA35]|nr:hypothetical protein BGX29_002454 [Mortierella sp. GBA35]
MFGQNQQFSSSAKIITWLWAAYYFYFLHFTATAQTPAPVWGMAYATIDENYFIIQGGTDYVNATHRFPVNQFWILDLTVSTWRTSSPPWQPIPVDVVNPRLKSLTTSSHSMSVSTDHQTLTIWDSSTGGSVTKYNLVTKT